MTNARDRVVFIYSHAMHMPTNHLAKIQKFYRTRRRMPSYREVAALMGYKSSNAAYKLVGRLAQKGVLARGADGRILPARLFGAVSVLGAVEAGFPSPAEEELQDTMSLDEYLIKNREATFLLKVSGDSMKDAGIMPGDLVVVERGPVPRDGDIVVAEVDHAWTMKRFRKSGKRVWLEAANPKYRSIVPAQELTISAVVRAVVRKYV